MHSICTLQASPKKGESITLRFLVVQRHPWPACGSHGWENAGELFGQYGQPPAGIGEKYAAFLLAEGCEPPQDYNRTHFAGYDGNAGSFALRGKDLGEISIEFDRWEKITVRGYDAPTSGERDFIVAHIVPALRSFIAENKAALRVKAIADTKARMREQIRTGRIALDAMEAKIETTTY